MEVDVGCIKTDSFGLIIFPFLQKLMDARDPHQGGDIGTFDCSNGGSDTKQISADSKEKSD
jgi:hypothetical protein